MIRKGWVTRLNTSNVEASLRMWLSCWKAERWCKTTKGIVVKRFEALCYLACTRRPASCEPTGLDASLKELSGYPIHECILSKKACIRAYAWEILVHHSIECLYCRRVYPERNIWVLRP